MNLNDEKQSECNISTIVLRGTATTNVKITSYKMLKMHLSSGSKIEVGILKPKLTLYGFWFAVANSYVLHTPN